MRTLDDDGIKVMFERRAPYLRYLANIAFTGTVASCFVRRKLGRWFGLLLLLPALLYPLWQATFIALIPTLSNAFMKNKEVIEQPINFTNMTQRILRESIGFFEGETGRWQTVSVYVVLFASSSGFSCIRSFPRYLSDQR